MIAAMGSPLWEGGSVQLWRISNWKNGNFCDFFSSYANTVTLNVCTALCCAGHCRAEEGHQSQTAEVSSSDALFEQASEVQMQELRHWFHNMLRLCWVVLE